MYTYPDGTPADISNLTPQNQQIMISSGSVLPIDSGINHYVPPSTQFQQQAAQGAYNPMMGSQPSFAINGFNAPVQSLNTQAVNPQYAAFNAMPNTVVQGQQLTPTAAIAPSTFK